MNQAFDWHLDTLKYHEIKIEKWPSRANGAKQGQPRSSGAKQGKTEPNGADF